MNSNRKIYQEIVDNFRLAGNTDKLENKRIHLGIFKEPYLSLMIEGKKTIESRFSINRIDPYGKIASEDIIIVKKSGGDVIGFIEIQILYLSI